MIDFKKIKEGQKITFTMYGMTYTRKIQQICSPIYDPDRISFNVNRVGSGTGYTNVRPEDILEVK